MNNGQQIRKAIKEAGKEVSKPNPYKKDVDYTSKMGYRDDSPFKERPFIDINTPNGIIDMSATGIPLFANGKLLPAYSGLHQFEPGVVREIPAAQVGGWLDRLEHYATGGPSPEKAKAMLEDGSAYGHPLSSKQISLFRSIVQDAGLDEPEEYRKGGMYHGTKHNRALDRNKTSRNIKTSLNFLMARNFDLYGLPGTRFYDPNAKMQKGGWLDNYK